MRARKVDDLTKEYLISFFQKKLDSHGDSAEALGWTRTGQALHYEALLDVGEDLRGMRILDYGCGKGDFYSFLRQRGMDVRYTGTDINGSLIALARERFPECTFKVLDIEHDELYEDFDYIFLCGVFNVKVENLDSTIRNVLTRLFRHCGRALVFNALSRHNPQKHFELHYVSPEDMMKFAVENLSPYVMLRQDRIPYDFTMVVRKSVFRDNGK